MSKQKFQLMDKVAFIVGGEAIEETVIGAFVDDEKFVYNLENGFSSIDEDVLFGSLRELAEHICPDIFDEEEPTIDTVCVPLRKTAAAVSSQDDSIPRIIMG